jgi:hypothetical protein
MISTRAENVEHPLSRPLKRLSFLASFCQNLTLQSVAPLIFVMPDEITRLLAAGLTARGRAYLRVVQ